jgi:hypothetical protein
LQHSGHPKWKEVDLNQDIGIWQRDACWRVVRRVSQQAPQTADDLLKAITDILKGKGQPRREMAHVVSPSSKSKRSVFWPLHW